MPTDPPPTGSFGKVDADERNSTWSAYGTMPRGNEPVVAVDNGVFGVPAGADAVTDWRASVPQRQRRASAVALPMADNDAVSLAADSTPRPPNAKERRAYQRPWVTWVIFLGCCAGFAYELAITPGIIAPFDINPMIGPTSSALISAGAKVTCLIQPANNQWWRLLTPMWLHAGVVHILMNMFMLRQVGVQLEQATGPVRYIVIYLGSAVMSMTGSAVFSAGSITVGASGAIFGLIGAFLAELISNCHLLTTKEAVCAFVQLSFTILINLALGLMPFVDNFAHLFGLIGGLCFGFALLIHTDDSGRVRTGQICLAACAVFMYIAFLVTGIALIYFKINGESFTIPCVAL